MDLSGFTPDQRKAVQHLDGPLLVCAGAGTGKTFTLTQRIAWALVGDPENGVEPFLKSIDEALVITFTNKAAAELKGRFRSTLRSVGKFEDALKVDSAWVSTIHGMCSRILKEHALELGIDPEFKLAMGAEAQDALLQAINTVIKDKSHESSFQPLFDEFDTYGVREKLEQVISQASCQTKGLDAFQLGPTPGSPSSSMRDALDAAMWIAENGKGKTQEKAVLISQMIEEFISQGTPPESLPNFVRSLETGRMRGNGVSELKSALKASVDTVNANRGLGLMQSLLSLARMVEAEYQAVLSNQGMVDTSDLIRKTLNAFDSHPEIAQQYSKRFKLIMVDEFQDTSQLQIDMIERIAGPAKTHLCTVGDSQQSIYRFQGADVGVYLKHKKDMQKSGALLVELQDNFRSHSDILAFVRSVCGRKGFFVEDFLDLKAGSNGRCYLGSSPRIELAVTMHDNGGTDLAVAEEAKLIASRFKALIEEGHKPSEMVILMGATTKMEAYASALRDQGIPCMAAGGSKFYESPHVKLCMSLINVIANPFDSISMMDILTSDVLPVTTDDLLHLSTFDNPESKMMTRQNFAQSFLYEERSPKKASALLQHAMKVLGRAWKDLGIVPPSKLLQRTIIDSGWIERLQAQGEQGQAAIANIMKLVRLVAEKEEQEGFDMCRISAAMQAAANTESEAPGVLSVEGLEAVRLMTVHASKGLEFPIVAVTNCFTSLKDSGALRVATEDGCIYASLFPKETKLEGEYELPEEINLSLSNDQCEHRAKIIEVDSSKAEAERRRLFYVAATRATDALIIAMHKRKSTKETVFKEIEADLLNAIFPDEEMFPEQNCEFEYGGSTPGRFTRIDVSKEEETAERKAEEQESSATQDKTQVANNSPSSNFTVIPMIQEEASVFLQPSKRRNDFFSYSSLSAASHETNEEEPEVTEKQSRAEQALIENKLSVNEDSALSHDEKEILEPDKATDFGSALHRTCQWMALTRNYSKEDALKTARRFGKEFKLKNQQRLNDAVARWQSSEIAKKAYSYKQIQPEVPFTVEIANGYLEGEIDLLCTNEDGEAFVVDYKTGGHSWETKSQLEEKHLLQSQCYAYALLNHGYDAVTLHFVRVEQSDKENPEEPEVISYEYAREEIKVLESAISQRR